MTKGATALRKILAVLEILSPQQELWNKIYSRDRNKDFKKTGYKCNMGL